MSKWSRIGMSIWLICMGICTWAEPIPPGYYANAEGKSDSLLMQALHDTIRGGIRFHYGTQGYVYDPVIKQYTDERYAATWTWFVETDRRADGTIWDMYSRSIRYYPAEQGESACSIQIEHCLPKSWWGWSNSDTIEVDNRAYKDLYNLNPADARANGQKSNAAPGHVTKGDKFDNGSFRMDSKSKSAYGYICFEPEPDYRGDFARSYFYIVTAYKDASWSSTYAQYVNPVHYTMLSPTLIEVLLDWHRQDPVSTKEVSRANRISSLQHNRNPYIDYPELVEYIWGDRQGQIVHFGNLLCTVDTTYTPYVRPTDTLHLYDTLISLPALTKNLVNAVEGGYASDKIQSNGTRSITMGASSTDGYLTFSNLSLTDTARLVLRASVYNTADCMQLDIYADTVCIASLRDTARQETRSELYYSVSVPAGTDSLTLISVGGSTKQRACMQELYLLAPRSGVVTDMSDASVLPEQAEKVLMHGHVYIRKQQILYDLYGQPQTH